MSGASLSGVALLGGRRPGRHANVFRARAIVTLCSLGALALLAPLRQFADSRGWRLDEGHAGLLGVLPGSSMSGEAVSNGSGSGAPLRLLGRGRQQRRALAASDDDDTSDDLEGSDPVLFPIRSQVSLSCYPVAKMQLFI